MKIYTVMFLSLFLIDSIYATDFNKAQTSKSGVVDMFEVLPEYLQTNSTAENRDFHIKRNERAVGSGTQYYFYMEGGTVTVSMTTNGLLRLGNATIIGTSTAGIGTTTPTTALQVIGTVTANGFSGNGSQLTNIPFNSLLGNYLNTWSSGGIVGTGTLNFICTGDATSTASYDNNGNGTITVTYSVSTGNDQYTKLLLHGDQVGSLSTFLDSSEQELTVTAIGATNGTTTQSVFGGSSFYFGTATGLGNDSCLSIADNSRLELGSNDFMLESRVRFIDFTAPYLFLKVQNPTTDYIYFAYDNGGKNLYFQNKVSSAFVVNVNSGSWTASLNTWYHIACIRKGSNFRFYVDGSQIGNVGSDTDPIADNTAAWTIGGYSGIGTNLHAYVDEIRMTIGTGRKTGTYTASTVAYGSFTSALSN